MNYFEKKGMELLYERCHKYHSFYENINYEKHKDSNKAQKILWWQKLLNKKEVADDYYFFVYSLLMKEKLETLNIGYEFLYGMSDKLRQDKDFEKILIKLSGDTGIEEYVSKRKLTYLEAANEYYHAACIGTHECKKFEYNCWKCILSHYDPDELYDSLTTRFQNAVKNSEEFMGGPSNNEDNELHYAKNEKDKSLVKKKSNRRKN